MTNPNDGTKGTAEINKDYPINSGLGVNDKHVGRIINLVADESNVSERYKEGL